MPQGTHGLDAEALEKILEVSRKLSLPLELDQMLREIVQAAEQVIEAERASVFLYDPVTHEFEVGVATGLDRVRFSAESGIVGDCARMRRIVNVPDCYADPRFNPAVDRATGYRTRCLLSVPLVGLNSELVGVMQVLNRRDGVFDETDEKVAAALASQCAVALQRAWLLRERLEKQKLERDLEVARDIQRGILPGRMPLVTGYDLWGWTRPAEHTGGDIYDVFSVRDGRILLAMCDATGHGIGPALSVTQVRAMLRMAVRFGAGLAQILIQINQQLSEDLAEGRFVTMFLGELDSRSGRLAYYSAGQGPVLVLRGRGGSCQMREASTLPLGIVSELPLAEPTTLCLEPGDVFAVISDGIFEARSDDGQMFGIERVVASLGQHRSIPSVRMVQQLVAEVDQFRGKTAQQDDMTAVLVRRHAD